MEHMHLIGIGGTGLSAIARVLLERGYKVSGSDRQPSLVADELARAGAVVYIGHDPAQIQGADLVIRSSAVQDDNVEVVAAKQAGIPVLKRSEFLPRLLKDDEVIAIAGTHGKTTTTAMIAWALRSLGEDPSYIIGSAALNMGSNAHAGKGRYFVIEADEYDYMFLGLQPAVAVVTMLEHDHPDCFPTPEEYYDAFLQFGRQIKPNGQLIACSDDRGVQQLLADLPLSKHTYGLSAERSEYTALTLLNNPNGGYSFQLFQAGHYLADVSLQIPGLHNVLNALAALAVINELHLPVNRAAGALSAFKGTARRFQVVGEVAGITLIDDYAHHPTEIKATLSAARQRFPGRRIWAVWQPHTFSRTRQILFDFAHAFGDADQVIVTEIYPARELPPPDGFSSVDVVNALSHPAVVYARDLLAAEQALLENLKPGDVVLVLSAGDADQISRDVLAVLMQPERENHV
jgi:UDP-N-acetylmuramate--alanine ligase